MRNRLGSREYGAGLLQDGSNPQNNPARQAGLARRMKVDLVHLVCLVQPNKRGRPDKQERPAGSRALRFDRLTVLSHVEGRATVHRRGRHVSTSGKGRNRSAAQDVSGENRKVTSGRSTRRCSCPTGTSSWLRSASLSSGSVQKTVRSRLQSLRQCESMPASGLRRRGDERRKSHVFPEHRREASSRPPARVSLPVGTTNRQSSSLISNMNLLFLDRGSTAWYGAPPL